MTFKEYLDSIKHDVFAIEEHCGNRFVCTHLVFGFNEIEDDFVPELKDDYVLFGTDGYETPTYIDVSQPVEFKNNSIFVTDRQNNRIQLTFFAAVIIPHPIK